MLYLVVDDSVGACSQIVKFTEVLGLLLLSPVGSENGWIGVKNAVK